MTVARRCASQECAHSCVFRTIALRSTHTNVLQKSMNLNDPILLQVGQEHAVRFSVRGHSYCVRVCFVLKKFALPVEDKKHFQKAMSKSRYTDSSC